LRRTSCETLGAEEDFCLDPADRDQQSSLEIPSTWVNANQGDVFVVTGAGTWISVLGVARQTASGKVSFGHDSRNIAPAWPVGDAGETHTWKRLERGSHSSPSSL
jgi:hypothetical protein